MPEFVVEMMTTGPAAAPPVAWVAVAGLNYTQVAVLLGIVVVILLAILMLGIWLIVKTRSGVTHHPPAQHEQPTEAPTITGQHPRMTAPKSAPPVTPDSPTEEPDTAPPFDMSDPVTAPTTDPNLYQPPKVSEVKEMEPQNPELAAKLWEQLGRWKEAASCYERAEKLERAAEIWIALEQYNRAMPILRRALKDEPGNENIRMRLIETLTDLGQISEAEELVVAVASDGPLEANAQFLESVARIYEALGNRVEAQKYYQLALKKDDKVPELAQRLIFLKQFDRLADLAPESDDQKNTANRLMAQYIEESSKNFSGNGSQDELKKVNEVEDNEIIVGHLALGFQHPEPRCSVRSVFSLSRRFALQRLISEGKRASVFEAYDRLLDFPVALRIHRMSKEEMSLPPLRERLQEIAQLNHPNLAKLTFVERTGPILVIATEYLPGGNLREFLEKVGGVGLPLLIRMAMHLASGLHTAHLKGIPHGDIKPENIIIGSDQRPKLVDFALAPIPVVQTDEKDSPITDTGETPTHITLDNLGVHSDLLQFADVLRFMLEHVRYQPPTPPSEGGSDPMEEMQELAKRVRAGEFSSVLRLWQILEQVFERTLPAGAETPRARN